MSKLSKEMILQTTGELFAYSGIENFTIRGLAKKLDVVPSVVYYHFKDQDVLLRSMFDFLNHELGVRRTKLSKTTSAAQMLKQRINFQIENQSSIVAVLKYYLQFRQTFPKFKNGFVPDKSALHIEEVLMYGVSTGEFSVQNIQDDAKVITHTINGFLLEYFPYVPKDKEKKQLVSRIYNFLIRALKP